MSAMSVTFWIAWVVSANAACLGLAMLDNPSSLGFDAFDDTDEIYLVVVLPQARDCQVSVVP